MIGKCKDCYYYNLCEIRRQCSHFYPVENIEEYEDNEIETTVQKERQDFTHDWNMYIEQYDTD